MRDPADDNLHRYVMPATELPLPRHGNARAMRSPRDSAELLL